MIDLIIRPLTALLMIALPLTLGVYLARKLGGVWRLFGIGAIAFVVSQVFHIPFNGLVLDPLMRRFALSMNVPSQLVIIAILLGLSAGIFEEVTRYLFYRFWLTNDDDRTWSSAVMFGAGHGGGEAIILGVLGVVAFVRLLVLRDVDLSTQFPSEQLELARMQVESYWAQPWYVVILGAVERVAAIGFHVSAAVMVVQVFRRKSILWLFLAIGWHTILDAVAVFGIQTWGVFVTEALVVFIGVLSFGIILLLRDPALIPDITLPSQMTESIVEIELQKPSIDHLEDSRYD